MSWIINESGLVPRFCTSAELIKLKKHWFRYEFTHSYLSLNRSNLPWKGLMVDYRQIPEEFGKRGLRRPIDSSWRFKQFRRSYDDMEPYMTFFVNSYSNVEDVPI